MNGRIAIYSHTQRLDAAFARAASCTGDIELLADLAKYLCILVAGFIEKSFSEILIEHSRENGSHRLQLFVEKKTSRFTNANTEKVLNLLGTFDPDWRTQMELFLVDEKKAALDSVYGLRNQIAHGKSVGVTYVRISNYYAEIKRVIDYAQNLCIPI